MACINLEMKTEQFRKEFLDRHNTLRRKHGVSELQWSFMLEANALKWAKKCAKAGIIEHADQVLEGENIAIVKDEELEPSDVVDKWYKQIDEYDFDSEMIPMSTACFTQIVWKCTEKVGASFATSAAGDFYVVARYHPPGNALRHFKNMVTPPAGISTGPRKISKDSGHSEDDHGHSHDDDGHDHSEKQSMASGLTGAHAGCSSEDFLYEVLTSHNVYRQRHDAEKLKMSATLSRAAHKLAEKLSKKKPLEKFKGVGRNVLSYNGPCSGNRVSNIWYEEENDYNYYSERMSSKTGSFSQMVWAETKSIGIGRVVDKRGHTYVVCLYKPPGNVEGHFGENIGCPSGPPPLLVF